MWWRIGLVVGERALGKRGERRRAMSGEAGIWRNGMRMKRRMTSKKRLTRKRTHLTRMTDFLRKRRRLNLRWSNKTIVMMRSTLHVLLSRTSSSKSLRTIFLLSLDASVDSAPSLPRLRNRF